MHSFLYIFRPKSIGNKRRSVNKKQEPELVARNIVFLNCIFRDFAVRPLLQNIR